MWRVVLTGSLVAAEGDFRQGDDVATAVESNLRAGVAVLPDGSLESQQAKAAAQSLLQEDDSQRQVPSHLGRVLQRVRSSIYASEQVVGAQAAAGSPRQQQAALAQAHKADHGAYDPHDVEGVYAAPAANLAAGIGVPDPHEWRVSVCASTGPAQAEEVLHAQCTAPMKFQEADRAMTLWRHDLVMNVMQDETSKGRMPRLKDIVLTDAVPAGELAVLFEKQAALGADLAPGQAALRKLEVLPVSAGQLLKLFDDRQRGGFRGVFLDKDGARHREFPYRTALVVSHGSAAPHDHSISHRSAPAAAPTAAAKLAPADTAKPKPLAGTAVDAVSAPGSARAMADLRTQAKLEERERVETERERLEAQREARQDEQERAQEHAHRSGKRRASLAEDDAEVRVHLHHHRDFRHDSEHEHHHHHHDSEHRDAKSSPCQHPHHSTGGHHEVGDRRRGFPGGHSEPDCNSPNMQPSPTPSPVPQP